MVEIMVVTQLPNFEAKHTWISTIFHSPVSTKDFIASANRVLNTQKEVFRIITRSRSDIFIYSTLNDFEYQCRVKNIFQYAYYSPFSSDWHLIKDP